MRGRGILGWLDFLSERGLRVWEIILALGGLAVIVGVVSYWLATLSLILRLLAPWAYFVAALIGLSAFVFLLAASVRLSRSLIGWPRLPTPKLPLPDGPCSSVAEYIIDVRGWRDIPAGEQDQLVSKALLDKLASQEIHGWIRADPHQALLNPGTGYWANARMIATQGMAYRTDGLPNHIGHDVHLNWREVRRSFRRR